MTPILDGAGTIVGYMKILRDVTASKLAAEQVERLATFDILTGVANRISFDTRLAEMLSVAERGHQLLNLFAIDLDRFKEVNDQFGHGAGDMLLKQVAQRIRHAIREGDVIARLGGDEFALLQLNPPSANCAADLADKLLEALVTPFHIDGHAVLISGSIGIAVYPADATSAHDLRMKADLALYQAKKSGRNCFHYFTDALDDAVRQRNLDKIALRGIVADSTYPEKGKMSIVDGQFDKTTGAISVRAVFPNANGALRTGNTGRVRMPQLFANTLVIPQESTFEIQDKVYVYVVGKDKKVTSKPVTISGKTDSYYFISDGLAVGEKIVYTGIGALKDGVMIQPKAISSDSLLRARPL